MSANWSPKNEAEQAMARAAESGEIIGFLRAFTTAELYLPQVPAASGEGWAPLTQRLPGATAIPLFTSLAGMGSAVFAGRYAVTSFAEVCREWAEPGWWVAINPGTPIESYLPFDAVDPLLTGELHLVDGELVPPEPLTTATPVPVAPLAPDPDQEITALLEQSVTVPTTSEVAAAEAVLAPDFLWLSVDRSGTPTIVAFIEARSCALAYPERPRVTMPFLLLLLAWPAGHGLLLDLGGPAPVGYDPDEVAGLQRRAISLR
ncbi:SseB family protein [Natronosporangium hydrolyticum]|uniref:SseB family protein n=1 Tax=Natronosporangium hydrolyticum TaxID=2811111 RepID=A0A895YGZ2_9ACTN|nr:SseB family protein [Natronosporangium hydrolyticum]QSB15325.1 SseB family protein [Natronosporangium hydrolyticum]